MRDEHRGYNPTWHLANHFLSLFLPFLHLLHIGVGLEFEKCCWKQSVFRLSPSRFLVSWTSERAADAYCVNFVECLFCGHAEGNKTPRTYRREGQASCSLFLYVWFSVSVSLRSRTIFKFEGQKLLVDTTTTKRRKRRKSLRLAKADTGINMWKRSRRAQQHKRNKRWK